MTPPCNHKEPQITSCSWCYMAIYKDVRYAKLWFNLEPGEVYSKYREAATPPKPIVQNTDVVKESLISSLMNCQYLGEDTGERVKCPTCRGGVELKVFDCRIYGKCTIQKQYNYMACCNGFNQNGAIIPCPSYAPKGVGSTSNDAENRSKLKWAYGITTIPERRNNLFVRTLESLRNAGFDKPRLFVDGESDPTSWEKEYTLPVSARYPNVRTAGHWVLSLYELYIRNPECERFAIFQDDLIASRGLREYLSRIDYPVRGYLNLYTFPENQDLCESVGLTGRSKIGFYESNQKGKGAVALVFNREAVIELLSSNHLAGRPCNPHRGHKAIDGGIVDSMRKKGWKEYVHNPSLVQHTGLKSSMQNRKHPLAVSFRGESFNCMDLLEERKHNA